MTIIYEKPAEAMRRLMEIGVPIEPLQRAIEAGYVARITCTENDPPFIPGTMGWSHTIRALRDELCSRGWRKSDPGNFSLVISDVRKLQIVVESGDALVRNNRGSPRTKSLKGLYTEAATIRNKLDGDLFPETLTDELRKVVSILEYPTWIFLIHITDEKWRAELSFPTDMEGEQVTGWKERIFIPDRIALGGDSIDKRDDLGPSDIDIPVRRKA